MMDTIRLMEIEPDKQYILVMPNASREMAQLFEHKIGQLRKSKQGVLIIYGMEVAIVSADQVVGHTTPKSES